MNKLKEFVSLFFVKVNSIYNQDAIENVLKNKQNELIETKILKANYKDFSETIKQNIISLSENTYKRYVEEKTLFQAQIKIFFEKAFNNSFEEFILSSGATYLNDSVFSDYEKRIYPDFDIMKTGISDTFNTIQTLLTSAELQGLGEILEKKIIDAFPDARKKIQNIIPDKVENIIFTKIDLFKKESEDKISRLYIEELEKEISNIEKKLSSKVYELVPKQLESAFKGIIENSFRVRIEKSIEDIKEIYNSSVANDLTTVVTDLIQKDNNISKTISLLTITRAESIWGDMHDIYKNLSSATESYQNYYVFEISESKMSTISLFLTNKISPLLQGITDGFYEYVQIAQDNLYYALTSFDLNNTLIKDGLINITNSQNIFNNINKTKNELNSLFVEFKNKIIEKFEEFKTKFTDKVNEIQITGFNYNGRNRNLDEEEEIYDIAEMKKVYKEINDRYEEFKYNVLTKNEFYEIEGQIGGLQKTLGNTANTLTRDFFVYKHLISQYTDNEKIKVYFDQLNGKAEVIKKEITNYVSQVAGKLSEAINLVKTETENSWEIVKNKVDTIVHKLLDETFETKFNNLEEFSGNFTNTINSFTFTPLTVEIVNSNREIMNTIDIDINVINVKAGYSLKRLGTYDFTIDVYSGGDIELNAITNVNNQVIETIGGKLASGIVGITANYTLHNMDVDINAYALLNEVNYSIDAKTIEEWTKIYDGNKVVPSKELYIKRKISSTHYKMSEE